MQILQVYLCYLIGLRSSPRLSSIGFFHLTFCFVLKWLSFLSLTICKSIPMCISCSLSLVLWGWHTEGFFLSIVIVYFKFLPPSVLSAFLNVKSNYIVFLYKGNFLASCLLMEIYERSGELALPYHSYGSFFSSDFNGENPCFKPDVLLTKWMQVFLHVTGNCIMLEMLVENYWSFVVWGSTFSPDVYQTRVL